VSSIIADVYEKKHLDQRVGAWALGVLWEWASLFDSVVRRQHGRRGVAIVSGMRALRQKYWCCGMEYAVAEH
jgi:hypothetical protein